MFRKPDLNDNSRYLLHCLRHDQESEKLYCRKCGAENCVICAKSLTAFQDNRNTLVCSVPTDRKLPTTPTDFNPSKSKSSPTLDRLLQTLREDKKKTNQDLNDHFELLSSILKQRRIQLQHHLQQKHDGMFPISA